MSFISELWGRPSRTDAYLASLRARRAESDRRRGDHRCGAEVGAPCRSARADCPGASSVERALASARHLLAEADGRIDADRAGRRSDLRGVLLDAGLPEDVADAVVAALPLLKERAGGPSDQAQATDQARSAEQPQASDRPWSADTCLDALEAAQKLSGALESGRLVAARELSARTLERLLETKDLTPDDLDDSDQALRLRSRAKSVAAHEIEALTGLGRGESRDLVGVATAPREVRRPLEQDLHEGTSSWRLGRAFWRRCGDLPTEAAAMIATTLFGDDPQTVAPERLTPEGDLSDEPWRHRQFYTALEREAVRHESVDAAADRAARRRRHEARDAFAVIDDDGSARYILSGSTLTVTALAERIHVLAARARKAGDPRTQAQLRHDLSSALLLHGTLPLPDLPDEASLVTPEHIEALATIVSARPTPTLQVVVPWDALADRAAIRSAHHQVTQPCLPSRAGPDHRPAGVGQLLGRYSRFLSTAQVREFAAQHGGVVERLLTDPSDGRCLERSITAYRPDARMRRQLAAADVTCRAPGCTTPARDDDLDHVTEYLLGGATTEGNLQHLDRAHHALKTEKFWSAEMDASRNVSWTSFFGRLYRTRSHDYRQYAHWVRFGGSRPAIDASGDDARVDAGVDVAGVEVGVDVAGVDVGTEDAPPSPLPWQGPELDPDDQRARAGALVYAALAHREPTSRVRDEDDHPESDDDLLDGIRSAIWLRHTKPDGRRAEGVAPGAVRPEALLRVTPVSEFRSRRFLADSEDDPTPVPRTTPRHGREPFGRALPPRPSTPAQPRDAGSSEQDPGSPGAGQDDDPPPF